MTLAIQLLREHVADDVWQIRPHTPVTELTDAGFKKDRGYFLCVSPKDEITEFEFVRLRDICQDAGCYLVLIGAAERARIRLDDAIVEVEPPGTDRVSLLRTHTARMLNPEDVPAVDALLAVPEVLSWCRGSHRLAEIETVAHIVADVVRGRIERGALAQHLELVSQDGIRAWFSAARKELRPLIITLSFFGGLPLQTVLELEDLLSIKLRQAEGLTEPRDLFAVSGRIRLTDVSAHASTAEHEDSYGPVRTEIAEFNDLTWEESLALLLRTEYPSVRPVLISWLRDLADHHDTHVQRRAALTLGGFAQDSLSALIHDVIGPWVAAPDQEDWIKVAWAFTVPLAMADTAPRVARELERWAESDWPALVCTAAMVYGMALAPANPTAALSGLARIARRAGPDDEDLTEAAATGVVAMYLSGFATEALSAIRRWSVSKKKTERKLALLTFVAMAEYVQDTIDPANSPYADAKAAVRGKKQDWPSLLLEACQRETRSDVIGTAREALNNPIFSAAMLTALRHWFNQANDRRYLVRPLTNFVAALAATPHEADRLAYYLQAWAGKNPKGAAAQVRDALLKPSPALARPPRPQAAAVPRPLSGPGTGAAATDSWFPRAAGQSSEEG
jgi:hypothetical protein